MQASGSTTHPISIQPFEFVIYLYFSCLWIHVRPKGRRGLKVIVVLLNIFVDLDYMPFEFFLDGTRNISMAPSPNVF